MFIGIRFPANNTQKMAGGWREEEEGGVGGERDSTT